MQAKIQNLIAAGEACMRIGMLEEGQSLLRQSIQLLNLPAVNSSSPALKAGGAQPSTPSVLASDFVISPAPASSLTTDMVGATRSGDV